MTQMINATKDLFQNAFVLKGRLSRSGYWWAYLAYCILSILVSIAGSVSGLSFLSIIFSFVYLIPLTTAMVRRFHDAGKSGKVVAVLYVLYGVAIAAFYGAVFFAAGIALTAESFTEMELGNMAIGSLATIVISGLVMLAVSIYEFVILVKKSDGPNQYDLA